MAVNHGEINITKSVDKYGLTFREINWIWINSNNIYKNPLGQYPSYLQMANDVHQFIDNIYDKEIYFKQIKFDKEIYFIGDELIKWIDQNNNRLLIIIINFLLRNNCLLMMQKHTNNYSYLIYLLDIRNSTRDYKLNTLNEARQFWSSIEYQKSKYSWINKLDYDQIEWLWDYLKKMNKLVVFPVLPLNINQRYEYILSCFDLIGALQGPAPLDLLLIKIKKTWAQKKYRDSGKIKKPYHLPLSKDSHKKLKQLSDIFNKSQSDVLEFVIDKSYDDYIKDHEGNNKY